MNAHAIVTTARPTAPPAGRTFEYPVATSPLPTDIDGGADSDVGLLRAAKLTVPQAAKMLGIGETKVRELIRTGAIPVVRILGKTLLLERDLEAYLRSGYGVLRKNAAPSSRLPALPDTVSKSRFLT